MLIQFYFVVRYAVHGVKKIPKLLYVISYVEIHNYAVMYISIKPVIKYLYNVLYIIQYKVTGQIHEIS